jgi:hypothetical protein
MNPFRFPARFNFPGSIVFRLLEDDYLLLLQDLLFVCPECLPHRT